jgi:hypothetical protein
MSPSVGLGAIRARGVIGELHIRRPAELVIEAIAWHYRLRVDVMPLDGAEACVVRRGDRGTIIIRPGLDPGKRRFNLAHELGHFLIHAELALKPCTESDLAPWAPRPEVEREADEFATNLLLPEEFFVPRIRATAPSLDFVSELAREFSTSVTATALRYVELSGLPCAVVVSSDDGVEWFRVAEGFPGWFEKGRPVHGDSWAYSALRGEELPTGMQPILATAWFKERRWKDVMIREQAIRLGSYGKALSLIWIPE